MKCIKLMSITVALLGITVITSAQTLQEVTEAYNSGAEAMAARDFDKAITELEKCVDLAKQVGEDAEELQVVAENALPGLYFQKANAVLATRDYPATLQALEATVAAAEKYNSADVKASAEKTIPQIYLALGNADYQAQKYEEAIKNYEQVVARDPNNAGAYYRKGICYQNLKDEANMEESYKLAIEKGTAGNDAASVQGAKTQLSRYFYNAGIAARRAQKWDDAITAFTKTIEADDSNFDAYYALASSYNSKKSFNDAIAACEKALQIKTEGLDGVYYELGTAYAGKNDNGKACEYFKKVGEGPFLAGAKYQIETALKCN